MSDTASRLSHAGALLAAAALVMLTGKRPRKRYRKIRRPVPFTLQERRDFRLGGPLYEVKATVAAEFGISVRSVSDIIRGKGTSARVIKSLRDRMITADRADSCQRFAPFTADEREQFLGGGRYRGVQKRVATALQVTVSTVSAVVNGKTRSARVLSSLRSEMAIVDARKGRAK